MKQQKRIKGLLSPVVTPFKADLSPDPQRFIAQCRWLLTQNCGLAVFGTKGCGELLTPNLDFHFTPTPTGPPTGRHAALAPEIIESRGHNTLAAELEAFAAAIEGGPAYPIPPDEILHGVAVFEAIVASAARHQPVKVARD